MSFTALRNVVQVGRRQRRIHAIHAEECGADGRRQFRMVFIGFNRFQGTDRKTHTRPGPETHRIVARMAGGTQFRGVRIFLLQQLAETIEIGPPDIFVKGQRQPGTCWL